MKVIAVFTGTRAEYGLMKTLIRKLDEDNQFDLKLFISSTHLDSKFGKTINEIDADGITSKYLIPIGIDPLRKYDMSIQTSETIIGVSKALDDVNADYLIVLGDRYESLAAAMAANLMRVKVIHLHGGEKTLGAIDDNFRHAISHLSSIHFTSAKIHSNRVKEMLGMEKNIHNIGPMAIDGILNTKIITKTKFKEKTRFLFGKNNFLITYHSETLSKDYGVKGFENLLYILDQFDCNILFTSPNADKGSEKIKELINKFVEKDTNKRYFYPSLGQELYLNALSLFDCVIGNSSSGIIEAPLIGIKVLNIGDRQKGRYRFGEVTDVNNDKESLLKEIKEFIAHNSSFKKTEEIIKKDFSKLISPSKLIIKVLKSINNT